MHSCARGITTPCSPGTGFATTLCSGSAANVLCTDQRFTSANNCGHQGHGHNNCTRLADTEPKQTIWDSASAHSARPRCNLCGSTTPGACICWYNVPSALPASQTGWLCKGHITQLRSDIHLYYVCLNSEQQGDLLASRLLAGASTTNVQLQLYTGCGHAAVPDAENHRFNEGLAQGPGYAF